MEQRALAEFVARVRSVHARDELESAAIGVLDAFEAADVEALLLKGPALARLLYRADEHRGYADVDIIVAPGALDVARNALVGLGYVNASSATVFGIDDVAGIEHAEIWTHRGMRHGPLMVDLHWRLPGWGAPPEVAWSVLHAGRTSVDIRGREVPIPCRAGLALHIATHAAQHGPHDLKALGDLARGVERWPVEVWHEAAAIAAAVEATPAFAAGLRLLPAGAALAAELALPPTAELTWEILNRDARPRGTFHLQALAEARGVRTRADVVRRSLLPTRLWMTQRYFWAEKGGAWLVTAYAAHIVQAPIWAARAALFRRRARRSGREFGSS